MFRFTIRDVLWLTVVVGLAVGWWMEHSRREASIDRQSLTYVIEKAYDRQAREILKRRIETLENTIAAAGADVPEEPKGMTFRDFLAELERAKKSLPRK